MEQTPEDFDVDAWLTGAKLPEHSVEVYRRSDLLAVCDDIIRRIRDAEQNADMERAVGEGDTVDALRDEYERVMGEFKASGLVVRVRAITEDESAALRARLDAKEFTEAELPFHQIELASVAPRLTVEQAKLIGQKIGPQQVNKIWNAIFRASGEQPEVSPAFLPRRSGQGLGQE